MSQPIRGQGGHLGFLICPKHYVGRGHWYLASCEVLLNSIQWLQRRSETVSDDQGSGQPSRCSKWPEKHQLGRGCWDLLFHEVSLNSAQHIAEKKLKMSKLIRGQIGHLGFLTWPQKHKHFWRRWNLASYLVLYLIENYLLHLRIIFWPLLKDKNKVCLWNTDALGCKKIHIR